MHNENESNTDTSLKVMMALENAKDRDTDVFYELAKEMKMKPSVLYGKYFKEAHFSLHESIRSANLQNEIKAENQLLMNTKTWKRGDQPSHHGIIKEVKISINNSADTNKFSSSKHLNTDREVLIDNKTLSHKQSIFDDRIEISPESRLNQVDAAIYSTTSLNIVRGLPENIKLIRDESIIGLNPPLLCSKGSKYDDCIARTIIIPEEIIKPFDQQIISNKGVLTLVEFNGLFAKPKWIRQPRESDLIFFNLQSNLEKNLIMDLDVVPKYVLNHKIILSNSILEETKNKQIFNLNTFYGASDFENLTTQEKNIALCFVFLNKKFMSTFDMDTLENYEMSLKRQDKDFNDNLNDNDE